MSYYISKQTNYSFNDAEEKIVSALKEQGFGILSEIDMQATFKKKLDLDYHKYKILGACNPPFANKALAADDKVGTLLPCNVVLQEREEGETEISIVNPIVAIGITDNDDLNSIAKEVAERLNKALESI